MVLVNWDLIGSFGWLSGGDWWRTVSEEARRVAAEPPVPDLLAAPTFVSHSLYGYPALDALYGDKSKTVDRNVETCHRHDTMARKIRILFAHTM